MKNVCQKFACVRRTNFFFSSVKEQDMVTHTMKGTCVIMLYMMCVMTPSHALRVSYDIFNAPFHPRIHNMGNVGPLGWLHANMAWTATRIIDKVAYDGVDIRLQIAESLAETHDRDSAILEVGCGAGTLTKPLANHFDSLIAFDTSAEMLRVAKKVCGKDVDFRLANGVHARLFDVDVCITSFLMHELPSNAHVSLLSSMVDSIEKKNGTVYIIDIDPTYTPSMSMESGEPFVHDYLENFDKTILSVVKDRGCALDRRVLIEKHVCMWKISYE